MSLSARRFEVNKLELWLSVASFAVAVSVPTPPARYSPSPQGPFGTPVVTTPLPLTNCLCGSPRLV